MMICTLFSGLQSGIRTSTSSATFPCLVEYHWLEMYTLLDETQTFQALVSLLQVVYAQLFLGQPVQLQVHKRLAPELPHLGHLAWLYAFYITRCIVNVYLFYATMLYGTFL